MIKSSEDGRSLLLGGKVLAYMAQKTGWNRDAWFLGPGLPEDVARAVRNAIFSLDGTPSPEGLRRRIMLILIEQGGALYAVKCRTCGGNLNVVDCHVTGRVALKPYGYDIRDGEELETDQEIVECAACGVRYPLDPVD